MEVTQRELEQYQPLKSSPKATGRKLVSLHRGVGTELIRKALVKTDLNVVNSSASRSFEGMSVLADQGDTIAVLERFGIAVLGGQGEKANAMASMLSQLDEVKDVRPEFWMYSYGSPPWPDNSVSTWGMKATGASSSQFNGKGVKLAVLDTGFYLKHPDFAGRRIVAESFVPGESVDDVQGHGTHCAGTAASPGGGGNVPRYGVATAADLYIGKVLGNNGSGREYDIIAGMEWAVEQGCSIISMSLGRATSESEPFDPIYEDLAQDALDAGCLIIAAAGNESDRRYGYVAPVGSPANVPSIMAVASIGSDGGIASTSCGSSGTGQIDICAPGVGVFSSFPSPIMYRKLGGTSMACPHVAGIAALWAQSDPALRGRALWDKLIATSVHYPGWEKSDFGQGLVCAP